MEYVLAVILCSLALLYPQVLTAIGGLKECRSIRQTLDPQRGPLSTPTSGYRRTTDYNQQTVVKCVLNGMQKNWLLALLEQDGMDVWGIKPDGSIDVRMQKGHFQEIRHLFPGCVTLIEDVEAYVREAERQMLQVNVQTSDWFENYHSYPEIVNWYCELANAYPQIVKYVPSIGKSVEGRDMPAVHITASASTNKKKLYFQCQIHAREWITGATCMYIANYLTQNYGKDQEVTDLLNSLEFILVPIVNPDGYVYTWTADRLWRKNRQKGEKCNGVDLNRNYNFHWAEIGSSNDECSQTYHGQSVESEPETQNVVKYFRQHGPILGAIDWHSYSQRILRPWGNTDQSSPHEEALLAMSNAMSKAAYDVHHIRYKRSKGIDLYPTSGIASDWFYSNDAASGNKGYRSAGITIELRDTGQYGFLLPPDQIKPVGEEMVPAVLYFAKYLLNNPLHHVPK